MIVKGADQDQIPLFQLVLSILDHVGGVALQKIDQLIVVMGMHGIGITG